MPVYFVTILSHDNDLHNYFQFAEKTINLYLLSRYLQIVSKLMLSSLLPELTLT